MAIQQHFNVEKNSSTANEIVTVVIDGEVTTPYHGAHNCGVHFIVPQETLSGCENFTDALKRLGSTHVKLAEQLKSWTRVGGKPVAIPGRWRFHESDLHFTTTSVAEAEAILLVSHHGVRWYAGLNHLVAFATDGLNGVILPLAHLGAPDGLYAGLNIDRIREVIQQAAS